MVLFNLFLSVLYSDKKIHDDQTAREAIRGAIHETRLFKNRRNVIDPANVYLCTNEECLRVRNAWEYALECIQRIDQEKYLYLSAKLDFWSSEQKREEDGYHVANPGTDTPSLEEIERVFNLK